MASMNARTCAEYIGCAVRSPRRLAGEDAGVAERAVDLRVGLESRQLLRPPSGLDDRVHAVRPRDEARCSGGLSVQRSSSPFQARLAPADTKGPDESRRFPPAVRRRAPPRPRG